MAAKAKTTIVYTGNEKAATKAKESHEKKRERLGYPSISEFARRAMDAFNVPCSHD